MDLDPEIVQYVALGAAAVGVLGLLAAVLTARSVRRLRRATRLLDDGEGHSFVEAAARHVEATGQLRAEVADLRQLVTALGEAVKGDVQHVAVVRYDAFAEMGGRMSFSLALLDARGDGVVLSAINGRTETRCYAKEIVGGAASQELSPEEKDAITQALGPGR